MKLTFFHALSGIFLLLLLLQPQYDYKLLNEGFFFHVSPESKDLKEDYNVVFYKDSVYSAVLVRDSSEKQYYPFKDGVREIPHSLTFSGPARVLKLNGKSQCSNARDDIGTNTFLAGLPLLYSKNPKSALNIGLGCALSLSILEKYPLKEITTIEIDPAVVEAAHYFEGITNNALKDQRSKIVVDDARAYLMSTDKKFDIIVSEPPDFWSSGASNVVTKETFELMKSHLADDGIVSEWVPMYLLVSPNDDTTPFKIIYKTFSSVFPYTKAYLVAHKVPAELAAKTDGSVEITKWGWTGGEIILLGSKQPFSQSKELIEENLSKGLQGPFQLVGVEKLSTYELFDGSQMKGYANETIPLHTDDKPVLEFLTAKNIFSRNPQKLIDEIGNYKKYGPISSGQS